MQFLQLPFFDTIEPKQNILLLGAGGGFDMFCGLPLYYGLKTETAHDMNTVIAEYRNQHPKKPYEELPM